MKQGYNESSIIAPVVLITIIVLVLGTGIFFTVSKLQTDSLTRNVENEGTLRVLLVVTDEGLPVSSQLFFFKPDTGKGALLSIPGKLGVLVASTERYERLDLVYREMGRDVFMDEIARVTRKDIPWYIELDLNELSDITDLLGGIDIFNERPYEAVSEDDMVLVPGGDVFLDGSKAKTYFTFEDESAPGGEKQARQQRFFQLLLDRISARNSWLTDSKVWPYFKGICRTNFSSGSLRSFVRYLEGYDAEGVIFQRIIGDTKNVESKELLFPYVELTQNSIHWIEKTMENADLIASSSIPVELEILNGTKTNGLAKRTSYLFQSFGFPVNSVSNADDQDQAETQIIVHYDDIRFGEQVGQYIRCENVVESTENVSGDEIRITIILGKDFDGRYCKN